MLPPGAGLEPSKVSYTAAPDGSAYSILFTDFSARVNAGDKPGSVMRTVAVSIPVTVPSTRRLVGFRSSVRGHVFKDRDTRILLLADCGGTSRTLVLPFGKNQNMDLLFDLKSARLPSGTPYVFAFSLLVQKVGAGSEAAVTIDSLDVVPLVE